VFCAKKCLFVNRLVKVHFPAVNGISATSAVNGDGMYKQSNLFEFLTVFCTHVREKSGTEVCSQAVLPVVVLHPPEVLKRRVKIERRAADPDAACTQQISSDVPISY
jgi:hypothetical protein